MEKVNNAINRRLIMTIMMVGFLVLIATAYTVTASAAEEAKLVIKTPSEMPKAGDTFTVSVDIENNPGLGAINFALVYDRTEMTCTGIKNGEVLSGALSASNPVNEIGAMIAAASLEGLYGNGVIGYFEFKAIKDVTDFDFSLERTSMSDTNAKPVAYTVALKKGENESPVTPSDPGKPSTPTGPTDPTIGDNGFTDTSGHWGEAFIIKAADLGLFKGYADGSFKPDTNVTRAQFVTVLYRLSGSPEIEVKTPFTDISDQIDEFQKSISWGYSKGFINGKSSDSFDPNGTLTRQEAMKILYYYSGADKEPGMEMMFTSIYDSHFTDSGEIATWAKSAMYWGVYKELISGTTETTLSPKGFATRAQLAKIMVGYLDKFNKGGEVKS